MFICIRCGHKELRGPFICKCGGLGFRVVAKDGEIAKLKERDKRRKEIDLLRQIHQVGRETHGM